MIERQNNFEDFHSPSIRLHKGEYKFDLPFFDKFLKGLSQKDFTNYPDMKYAYDVLMNNTDLSYDECILGEGSERIIKYAFEILHKKVKNVIIPNPAFPMFKVYASLYGLDPIYLDYNPKTPEDLKQKIEEAIDKYPNSLFCLSNPHSPYGEEFEMWDLFRHKLHSKDSYLLEDRAYYGTIKKEDFTFKENNRVLISYTFSKYFGGAGVRLGLGIAHKSLMYEIKQWRTMFECSGIAVRYLKYYFENIEKITHMYDVIQGYKKNLQCYVPIKSNIFSAGKLPWFFINKKPKEYYYDKNGNCFPVYTTYDKNLEMYKVDVCKPKILREIL